VPLFGLFFGRADLGMSGGEEQEQQQNNLHHTSLRVAKPSVELPGCNG
jgi:hypothetical protein